jgi:hypothetical protein
MPSGPLRLKSQRGRFAPIGLATNPSGVEFRCGTCEYFEGGTCENQDPRLQGQKVDAITECCNRYDHAQMKVRIQ